MKDRIRCEYYEGLHPWIPFWDSKQMQFKIEENLDIVTGACCTRFDDDLEWIEATGELQEDFIPTCGGDISKCPLGMPHLRTTVGKVRVL